MNVFSREIKANLKSLIFWSVGVLAVIAGGMGKYAGFESSGQDVGAMFSQFPKELLAMFGIGNLDLSTAGGFYGVIYIYLLIMAGIHAAMLGANILAKEERDKTSEFLFVKPISRRGIITAKVLAGLVNVLLFNILSLLMSLGVVAKTAPKEDLNGDILMLMAGMLFFQLIFLFIGTAMAALSLKPRAAAKGAAGLLLGTYLIYALIQVSGKLDWLKYLSPFKYFEAEIIMASKSLDMIFIGLSLVIIGICLIMTYVRYQQKDLNV
jgi:ABC-2 type transport system permease protein